ncbi:hypothetical protein D2917_00060 [Cupriavidus oxalaticus]|uniref:Stealth protein CR3 conserved region 3 domain-containing protein n=2 Tax=Cupriavidus oxalaticus TaxID=96344 RepID=A0A5P3VGH9_9BURK|nr:hypothetical protein D2917_00060 [Cupriavidus oxalaticus]
MFVTEPCTYHDFFDEADRSIAYLEPYGMAYDGNMFDATREFLSPAINSHRLISKFFPSWKAVRLHKHSPYALKKSILDEIEAEISAELTETRTAKVRTSEDINLPSFFYHHYALASGRAVEGDAPYLIVRPTNINKLTKIAGVRGYKFLCFNDGDGSADDRAYLQAYRGLMSQVFPHRGSFEIAHVSWSRKNVSKTIMAYKTRKHRIPYIRKMIGDAQVSLDEGQWGLWENSKRCWLSYDSGADFHMVIQDDAIVAERFYEKFEKYLTEKPSKKVFSLFFRLKSKKTHPEFNAAATGSVDNGGFEFPRLQFGVAIVVESGMVEPMVKFADGLSDVKYKNIDDLRFSAFFNQVGVKTFYTLPSLVDHEELLDSTIRRDAAGRTATWFADGKNNFLLQFLDVENKRIENLGEKEIDNSVDFLSNTIA